MEDAGIIAGIKWIVGTVIVIFGGLGINKLAENRQKRKYELQNRQQNRLDHNEAIHETNNANKLEADGNIIALLVKRVETLEGEVREMQKEQLSQARRDATLTAKNEHLEKENTRQEGEITDLRNRNRNLNDKVIELTGLVHKLEIRISELTGQPIDVRLVEGEKEKT